MKNFREKILKYIKANNVGDLIKIIPSNGSLTEEEKSEEEKTKNKSDGEERATVQLMSNQTKVVDNTDNTDNADSTENEVSKRDALKNDLIKLNDKLNQNQQKSELVEMEYTPLTEEEIKEKATDGLDEKYQLKADELQDTLNSQKQSLEQSEKLARELADSKKQTITEEYLNFEKQLESSAIKRGIARSSIVQEQLKELGVQKIKDLLLVDDEVANKLKENSDKLSEYEKEYEKAVKSLDVEKAIEVKEKIDKITEKQNQKIEEVLKYNNTLKKQQVELDAMIKENSISEEEKTKINMEIFEKAYAYYMSLPREEALKQIKSDTEIRSLLGSNYDLLIKYLNNK